MHCARARRLDATTTERDPESRTAGELRHENGSEGVHGHVAKQQRAQQQVTAFANRVHDAGVFFLFGRSRIDQQLHRTHHQHTYAGPIE